MECFYDLFTFQFREEESLVSYSTFSLQKMASILKSWRSKKSGINLVFCYKFCITVPHKTFQNWFLTARFQICSPSLFSSFRLREPAINFCCCCRNIFCFEYLHLCFWKMTVVTQIPLSSWTNKLTLYKEKSIWEVKQCKMIATCAAQWPKWESHA